jgi:sodium/potassium-transporting ATPase subunit beta
MPPESNVESTLIWYKGSDEKNWKYWTEELDNFLESKLQLITCIKKSTSIKRNKLKKKKKKSFQTTNYFLFYQ